MQCILFMVYTRKLLQRSRQGMLIGNQGNRNENSFIGHTQQVAPAFCFIVVSCSNS